MPRPFSPEEADYRKYCKKSLVAAGPLQAGLVLTAEHLVPLRATATGLPPDQIGRLVGRQTRRDIAAYHLVGEEDVV